MTNYIGLVGFISDFMGSVHSCEWLSRSALFWLLSAALIPLVHQFRMIDPSQRGFILIEQAHDELMEEVRTRVAAMLD